MCPEHIFNFIWSKDPMVCRHISCGSIVSYILFHSHFNLDICLLLLEKKCWSIAFIFINLSIGRISTLTCGYIFVVGCSSLFPGHCHLNLTSVLEKFFWGAYLIIWGRNHTFGIWIHLQSVAYYFWLLFFSLWIKVFYVHFPSTYSRKAVDN